MSRTRTFNIDDARVSREFLEQQQTDVKRTMNASEQALQAFVGSHGGVRLPDQSRAAAERLATIEAGSGRGHQQPQDGPGASRRLCAKRSRVRSDREARPLPAPRMSSPEVERLRNELSKLESALLELRQKYTEEHPRIQLVKNRIEELTNSLGGALKDSVASTPTAAVPAAERFNFSEQVITLESTHSLPGGS